MQHTDNEPAGAEAVQTFPNAVGVAGDPWAGCEERAVVRVTLVDGTILTGGYTGRAGMHFLHLTGRDQPLGGTVSGPSYRARDVRAVQIVRSRSEVMEDAETRLFGERVPGREPVTRDDHEHRLQALARAAAAGAERDWQREMQVRRQFDRLADRIQLAAGKRAWLIAAAKWGRRSNAPPTMADLWIQDVASPSCFARPRPQDFDPDPVARRRRVPLPERVRLDPRSIPNMLRALRDAALKARITRLGDPQHDRGHIQVDMPMKGRSRFVVMGARDDTGRMVWRLLWDGNDGEAGRRRHRIALASDAYSRLIEVVARGRVRAPGDRGDGAHGRAGIAPATPSARALRPTLPGGPMRLIVLFLAAASMPFAAGAQPVPPPAPACLSVAELEALLSENRPLAAAFCERGDVRAQERVRTLLQLLRHDGVVSAGTTP